MKKLLVLFKRFNKIRVENIYLPILKSPLRRRNKEKLFLKKWFKTAFISYCLSASEISLKWNNRCKISNACLHVLAKDVFKRILYGFMVHAKIAQKGSYSSTRMVTSTVMYVKNLDSFQILSSCALRVKNIILVKSLMKNNN